MNIPEKIALYLHTIVEDRAFERLSTLCLHNFGYRDINPVGGKHDRGRDAEIMYFKGETPHGVSTYFFYTRDRRSESKFKHDIAKIRKYGHEVSQIVVVTIQKITGAARKKWEEIAKEYECEVRVHDEEWFILQLTSNQNIAVAAGILDPAEAIEFGPRRLSTVLPDGASEKGWALFRRKEYEAALPELRRIVAEDKTNANAWSAIAWCQYQHSHYRDALVSIHRALEFAPDNNMFLGMQGCILAEQGIENHAPASLIEAKAIFTTLAENPASWQEPYNLANVLAALGDHEGARRAFERALAMAPKEPMIWKNLGTAHCHLGNLDDELRCYDKALELNPNLTEALVSKAIRLIAKEEQLEDAQKLLHEAMSIDEGLTVRWPHFWYWLGYSHWKLQQLGEAIRALDRGLAIVPDDASLLSLKADIHSEAWRIDLNRSEEALSFFQRLTEICPDSLASRQEVVEILSAKGDFGPVNDLINDSVPTSHRPATSYLELSGLTPESIGTKWLRYLSIYRRFRLAISPIKDICRGLYEEDISVSDEATEAMDVRMAAVFGTACNEIARALPTERTEETLKSARAVLRDLATPVLRQLTLHVAESIPVDDMEILIQKLTPIIIRLPDICLVDISRQFGYICGQLNIPQEVVDASMEDLDDTAEWHRSLYGEVFIWANEVLRIAKDNDL